MVDLEDAVETRYGEWEVSKDRCKGYQVKGGHSQPWNNLQTLVSGRCGMVLAIQNI